MGRTKFFLISAGRSRDRPGGRERLAIRRGETLEEMHLYELRHAKQ